MAAADGSVGAGVGKTEAQAAPGQLIPGGRELSFRRMMDLTHTLSPEFPVFPAFRPMEVRTDVTIEKNGFFARTWEVGEHTGTHMDAPAHFAPGDHIRALDEIPATDLIAPLAVIDVE